MTTSAGFPVATTVTKTGALPEGVTFTDNGDGTAPPGRHPRRRHRGQLPAHDHGRQRRQPRATQSFTLTVIESPVITSADHATFAIGERRAPSR